jgi:hypothetical protein
MHKFSQFLHMLGLEPRVPIVGRQFIHLVHDRLAIGGAAQGTDRAQIVEDEAAGACMQGAIWPLAVASAPESEVRPDLSERQPCSRTPQ